MEPQAPIETHDYDLVPPEAESTLEGHRAFGYELPTALADIVDNSITAKAKNIWIDFSWDGDNSTITLTDDGTGMSEPDLVNAMRLSCKNPRHKRDKNDLGRFGLGLKTASLSQCTRFSVRSKANGTHATRCWDLGVVTAAKDWRLLRSANPAAAACFARLMALQTGTAVVWQHLDRITLDTRTDSDRDHQIFLRRIDEVRKHLSLVFHRLIDKEQKVVTIWVNNHEVLPWDPYLRDHEATYALAPTPLPFAGSKVEVRPYVLPHLSRIPLPRHEEAEGPNGWNSHQGFYIYRNHRLLVSGTWLGFFPRQDIYRLARIQVDLPNSTDDQWQIDVTKSRAVPPPALQDDLRRIASKTREQARHVYVHRGTRLVPTTETSKVFLWEPRVRQGKTFYQLNREHALVKAAGSGGGAALAALLRMIEESVPSPHITLTNSERPDQLSAPFEGVQRGEVQQVMEELYLTFRKDGRQHASAIESLARHTPFDQFPELIASIDENPPHA